MSKEYKLEFNDNYIVVEEPYEKDKGVVVLSKTDDCSLHILYESYNPTHIDFFIKLIKYVADLEAKLAESEKELNRYAELFGMKDKDFYVVEKTEYEKMKQCAKDIVMQLKQQIAEKEEQYVQSLIKLEKEYDEQLEKQAKIHYGHLKEKDQDKISFAVGQLEKVKDYNYTLRFGSSAINEFIDNQISELTHQHEDKKEKKNEIKNKN
ncbi:MAG: hypothetical protein IKI95_08990 [Clostridia bacterium]|nr:hypothetical protein [Clostridia bacterium]